MGMTKTIRALERVVEREWNDFAISTRPGNHLQVVLRDGDRERTVTVSATASDQRALLNARSDIRRAAKYLRETRL